MGANDTSYFLSGTKTFNIQNWQVGRRLEINGIEKSTHLHRSNVQFRRYHIKIARSNVSLGARHWVDAHGRPIDWLF